MRDLRRRVEGARVLSLDRAAAVIAEAERKHRVDEWTVGGLRVWPVVRARLVYGVAASVNQLDYSRSTRVGSAIASKVGVAVRALAGVPQAVRTPTATYDAAFMSDGISFATIAGREYERCCDPIREELGEHGHRSYLLVPGKPRGPLPPNSFFVQPWLDAAKAAGVVRSARAPVNTPDRAEIAEALDDAHLGGFLPSDRFLQLAAGAILGASRTLERWLRRTHVRVGLVVDYYSLQSMAFVLACRSAGIPSVDLQHGVQGRFHPAYGGWARVPSEGFELVPDNFWVWSAEEADAINEWHPPGVHEPIVGGNPLLRAWRRHAFDDASSDLPAPSASALTVLVTLHGREARADLEDLAAAISAAPGSWRWWLRAHPAHPAGADLAVEVMERARIGNVDVRKASQALLFALLSVADVHVTALSSVVIDAAGFGVPSIVTDPAAGPLYEAQRAQGLVRLVDGVREVPAAASGAARMSASRAPVMEDGGMAWLNERLRQR